jgi:hypothetical protein
MAEKQAVPKEAFSKPSSPDDREASHVDRSFA